jgi:hypothetical protein
MPIFRLQPGDIAPRTGRYNLVGHYGEATTYSVRCNAGDRLPLMAGPVEYGRFWFVLVDEANEQARVA